MSCNHLFMHLNKIKKGKLAHISGNFMFNKFTISLRPHLPISPSFNNVANKRYMVLNKSLRNSSNIRKLHIIFSSVDCHYQH